MTSFGTTTLDSYQIVRELARGGNAATVVARDATGRQVVLKTLEAAPSEQGAQFLYEARLLRQLRHPGLVALYDFGRDPRGTCFMTMEYVVEGSLQRRIRTGGALPKESALRITRQVAEALSFLHGCGVVHRDIKPANIMLRGEPGDEQIIVVDFGLARIGGSTLTAPDLAGTAGYVAPEALGDPRGVDPRADVFALGTVLAEMVTGERVDGTKPPALPDEIRAIVERCREPAPHDRYPSMAALRSAIDRILDPPAQEVPIISRVAISLPLSVDESLPDDARAELTEMLDEDLDDVLATLGLPGRIESSVIRGDDEIEISFDGRRRGFSSGIVQCVRAAVEQVLPSEVLDRDDLLGWLSRASRTMRRDFLRYLTVTVATSAADLLVTSAAVDGYLALLRRAGLDLADAAEARAVLAEVVAQQLAVADVDAVARAWKQALGQPRHSIVEEIIAAVRPDAIELRLAPGDFRRLVETGSSFHEQFKLARDAVFHETGIWAPAFRPIEDGRIANGTFRIRLRHLDGPPHLLVPLDRRLMSYADGALVDGATPVLHPVHGSGSPMVSVPAANVPDGVQSWSPLDVLVLDVVGCLFADGWRLIDRTGVEATLAQLAQSHPTTVALHRTHGDPVTLTRVLRGLAREGVGIRDLVRLLISQLDFDTVLTEPHKHIVLADALPVTVEDPVGTDEEVRRRIEFARMACGYILRDMVAPEGAMQMVTLEDELGVLIEHTEPDSDDALRVIRSIRAVHPEPVSWRRHVRGAGVLTHVGIRARVRAILEAELPHIPVLAYTELPADSAIVMIGRASLAD